MPLRSLRSSAPYLPLRSDSVHAVVTSPPYFGLRKYDGVPDTVWGGTASCTHRWGQRQRGKRKDMLPADQTTSLGRSGTTERQDGAAHDGGRFCVECGAWRGCLGNEPFLDLYVSHMVEVMREVRRVLRPDGTLWLVLGDSYGRGQRPAWSGDAQRGESARQAWKSYPGSGEPDEADGQLLGVPWQVAFALQADGWLLRSDTIWAKMAPMPESVCGWRWERHRRKVCGAPRGVHPSKSAADPARPRADAVGHTSNGNGLFGTAEWEDCPGCPRCKKSDGLVLRRGSWRPTRAHEFIFLLARQEGYFCDAEAVREDAVRDASGNVERRVAAEGEDDRVNTHLGYSIPWENTGQGRNPRDVWTFGPEPYAGAHFATFPTALVERILRAAAPERVCGACGTPWARVVDRVVVKTPAAAGKFQGESTDGKQHTRSPVSRVERIDAATIGWRSCCGCAAGFKPSLVLDPFAGSGTTGRVAIQLRRRAVLCDLSATYHRLMVERTREVQVELL